MKTWIALSIMMLTKNSYAQPWSYNFGTSTGAHSSGASTAFLPSPPNGTTYVRVGTGGGSINLEKPGINDFGSDTEIRAVAPTNSSVNKFSIVNYFPSKTFSIEFAILLGNSTGTNTNASTGVWYFFLGDGTSYSNTSGFSGTQVFVGLRFSFGASGALTVTYRKGTTWAALDNVTMTQGTIYQIKIYGNNSTSTATYDGGNQSVVANTFDIYINGVKVGDDLLKSSIPDDVVLDSFMFYGEGSTNNVANIFIDNISYSNALDISLSVDYIYFTAKNDLKQNILSWATASEKDNAFFGIEHSINGSDFQEIAQVKGHGNTAERREYQYVHTNPASGVNYYRLRQVDFDASFAYSPVRAVWTGGQAKARLFPTFSSSEITLQINGIGTKKIYKIYNMIGALVLSGEIEDEKTIFTDVLPRGMYLLKINDANLKFWKD